ncbi:alpha/beta hydrolase [Gimesia maris]|uniref:alpha/beta hydrolase n=1 Tax=Gimesia maris TaxID=122 RepID=UPI0032EB03DB
MKYSILVRLLVLGVMVTGRVIAIDVLSASELETEELFPRIEAVSLESASLKKTKRAVVVLPEEWQSIKPAERRTLVILHGRGRHERSLIDDKLIRQQLLGSGLFIILPDGDDGWYLNSPLRKQDVYETYLEEVLGIVSEQYELPTSQKQWAIAGWSMGGFGCVRFAERHPGRFAAVSSIIGLLDFPRSGLPEGQSYKVPVDRFGSDEAVWKQFNPINVAEKLKGVSVLIITADQAFDRTMNEHFRDRLTELKLPHEYVELKGGHTFPVVRASIPLVLAHTKRVLQRN